MDHHAFDGEFWNVDQKTSAITRFQFARRNNQTFVSAWGACFPKECPWGETQLQFLKVCDGDVSSDTYHAFATWHDNSEPNHCLFELRDDELRVTDIAIRSDFPSYMSTMLFRKDEERSIAALHIDPVDRFCFMWDGTQPGWKLIRYPHTVFLVEFEFEGSGPTKEELTALEEYLRRLPGESDEQLWARLRGCTGFGAGRPLGPKEMEGLRRLQRENDLKLEILEVEPNEHLVLTPDGQHFPWVVFPSYRQAAVERMLDAGFVVEHGQLE